MARFGKIALAGGTFLTALAVGFFMQNGDALAERYSKEVVPSAPEIVAMTQSPMLNAVAVSEAEVHLPSPFEPDLHPVTPVFVAAASPDQAFGVALEHGAECDPVMIAVPADNAMVTLSVDAICAPGSRLTIHHQGMMFTAETDWDGLLSVEVPALAIDAVFIAAFDNGLTAVATTVVPDFPLFHRAVLQWQGDTGVALHAFENGAGYADAGHVFAGATGSSVGTLVTLGDDQAFAPQLAQVYSVPVQGPSVDLTVELEITAANCGQDISAQSLDFRPGQNPAAVDLTLTMPACDAVGDYLSLTTMFSPSEDLAALQ